MKTLPTLAIRLPPSVQLLKPPSGNSSSWPYVVIDAINKKKWTGLGGLTGPAKVGDTLYSSMLWLTAGGSEQRTILYDIYMP